MAEEKVQFLTPADVSYFRRTRQVLYAGALVFDEPSKGQALTFEEVRRVVVSRIPGFPRARQRVQQVPFLPDQAFWADDPDFDLSRHLRLHEVDDDIGIDAAVASCLGEDFDLAHPPWRIDVYQGPGERTLLVVSANHVMGDAQSILAGLGGLMLFDLSAQARVEPAPSQEVRIKHVSAFEMFELAAKHSAQTLAAAVKSRVIFAGHPLLIAEYGAGLYRAAASLRGRKSSPAPRAPFDQTTSGEVVCVSFARALDRLRAAGPASTVNDILLASVAAGLANWCEARQIPKVDYRAAVPVSLRDSGKSSSTSPSTQIGTMYVDLPVMDTANRLQAVAEQTSRAKTSNLPREKADFERALARVPFSVGSKVFEQSFVAWKLSNLTVSNFPGPAMDLYIHGHRLTQFFAFLGTGEFGLRIVLTSNATDALFSLTADAGSMADVELVAAGMADFIDTKSR